MTVSMLVQRHDQLGTAYVREALATAEEWAFMGLVACMGSPVDRQSTPLDECLSARLVIASIWPFVCMYPIMPLKVGLSIEALSKTSCCQLWS